MGAFYRLIQLSLMLVFLAVSSHTYAQGGAGQYGKMVTEVFQLVNEHRKELHLNPLTQNDKIATAAISHTKNMASRKIPIGHQDFDSRMDKLAKQVKNVTGFAENVAYGANTAKEVVEMWLNSPGHKKNIEGDYTTTGIGIVKGKDGSLYFTQIFLFQGKGYQ